MAVMSGYTGECWTGQTRQVRQGHDRESERDRANEMTLSERLWLDLSIIVCDVELVVIDHNTEA